MRGNVRKYTRKSTEISSGIVWKAARETNIVWKGPLMRGFSVLYGVFHILCTDLYGECTTPDFRAHFREIPLLYFRNFVNWDRLRMRSAISNDSDTSRGGGNFWHYAVCTTWGIMTSLSGAFHMLRTNQGVAITFVSWNSCQRIAKCFYATKQYQYI